MALTLPRQAKLNNIAIEILDEEDEFGRKYSEEELIHGGVFIQDTGKKEMILRVVARVGGDSRYEAIKDLANSAGKVVYTRSGTSQSQVEGYITDISAKSYDKSAIGLYTLSFTFRESALATELAKASLANNTKKARLALLNKTAAFIKNVYKTTARTIQMSTDTVNGIANEMNNIASAIPSLLSEAEIFTASIANFQASVQSFIRLPSDVNTQVKGLVEAFVEIGTTLEIQLDAIKNMLSSDLISAYDNTCSFANENSQATNPLQTAFYNYAISAFLDRCNARIYTTRDTIQQDIDYIRSQQSYAAQRIYDQDLINALLLYIDNTTLLLKQKAIQIPPVLEYSFENISDTSVYFMYYGNLDGIDAWRQYNNIQHYGIVNQVVKFY